MAEMIADVTEKGAAVWPPQAQEVSSFTENCTGMLDMLASVAVGADGINQESYGTSMGHGAFRALDRTTAINYVDRGRRHTEKHTRPARHAFGVKAGHIKVSGHVVEGRMALGMTVEPSRPVWIKYREEKQRHKAYVVAIGKKDGSATVLYESTGKRTRLVVDDIRESITNEQHEIIALSGVRRCRFKKCDTGTSGSLRPFIL